MVKIKDKSITNMFGSIAAAQTMCEQFPMAFSLNDKEFSCSFDLLGTLFELCSDVPLKDMIINKMTENVGDSNCTWLQGIEETVKMALELNLVNLLTCEMSPIIPDKLIGGATFLQFGESSLNFSSEGITIPLSSIDFTGILQNCPTDESSPAARANYMSCYDSESINSENPRSLTTKELWKHDDFNAFLWYVKNLGVYGNIKERQKLMWDNRYKTKPYTKYERKPEEFFTMDDKGLVPFNGEHLQKYNNDPNTKYKKKQILECRYIDGDGTKSDSFQFRLAASNYYKTRRLTGKKQTKIFNLNKTIFEFNHDFIMSLKLFDAKTYLAQIIQNTLGQGNLSLNLSISANEEIINEMVNSTMDNVINMDDTEIDDCVFNFSNDEYDMMIQNSITKKIKGNTNSETINTLLTNLDEYNNLMTQTNVPEEKTKTIINDVLGTICDEVSNGNNATPKSILSVGVDYDYKFELIRMLVYPLVKPLFSPKVITLILINTYVMGDPLKLSEKVITFNDLVPYFQGLLMNIIKQIKDIIIEMLYSWVIEKLIPLLSIFTLRVIMEQLEAYKKLIMDIITSCAGITLPLISGKGGALNQADYVDIDPELEKIKQTPISNTNC